MKLKRKKKGRKDLIEKQKWKMELKKKQEIKKRPNPLGQP